MSPGAVVWAVIGGAWILWTAASGLGRRRLLSIVSVVRAFLGSWSWRLVALAAWGGAGWHVFCQRP